MCTDDLPGWSRQTRWIDWRRWTEAGDEVDVAVPASCESSWQAVSIAEGSRTEYTRVFASCSYTVLC